MITRLTHSIMDKILNPSRLMSVRNLVPERLETAFMAFCLSLSSFISSFKTSFCSKIRKKSLKYEKFIIRGQ